MKSTARFLAALSLAALLSPAAARAGAEFGTTNVQLLHGFAFKDNLLGYNTDDGQMTTVTLNHFSTWAWGDNFAFVDFYRGSFLDAVDGATPNRSLLYAEWHPRLFLNKLGAPTGGLVKNWGLAGEINASYGFYAYLIGAGVDLSIPGFVVAGVNLYYRYEFVAASGTPYTSTWQLSPFWTVPFKIGPTEWLFTGFLDLTTNHDGKLDLMTQPELLLDVGALAGSPGKLHVGVEWYLHSYQNLGFVSPDRKTVSAPQIMVQWTPF